MADGEAQRRDETAVNLSQPHSSNQENAIKNVISSAIPPLSYEAHKGQSGRIAVIGGSREYTGAPYFAAISALKVGCDLSYVFCSKDAAPAIKSYSPEIIVFPSLGEENGTEEIVSFLPHVHSLIIGPGLGRHARVFDAIKTVIDNAKRLQLPMVLDADALFCINSNLDVIRGYRKAVLTPNAVEFNRLYRSVYRKDLPTISTVNHETVKNLSRELGYVTLVAKGPTDIISNGENVLSCAEPGSPRRCGGQGDLLSGFISVFLHWCHQAESSNRLQQSAYCPTVIAALAGCMLTRRCNRLAFQKLYRSMTTGDMVSEIGTAFSSLFASHA